MKQRSTFRKFVRFAATPVALCLLFMLPVFALATPAKKRAALSKTDPLEDKPGRKDKSPAKNSNSVKIYPDPLKKIMHVVARQNKGKEIDFFVFDLEGTLVLNYRMKAKDHQRIIGLPRGSYVYNVFCGDIQTASGNFEIK